MTRKIRGATMTVWMALLGFGMLSTSGHAEEVVKRVSSLRDAIAVGGWTMQVIIGLSFILVFLAIYFLFTMREAVVFPRDFVREAEDAAEEGDLEALQTLCKEHDCAAARVIGFAVQQLAGEQRPDYGMLKDAMEGEGGRQAGALWQRAQYLLDIMVIGPMLGLLGTVLGMLQAFGGVQTEMGVVKPTVLAQGVAKALITTVAGLIVGIVAMMLYSLFRGRVVSLVAGMESVCTQVLRRFVAKRTSAKR